MSSQKWPLQPNREVETKHVLSVHLIFQLSPALLFKWMLTGKKCFVFVICLTKQFISPCFHCTLLIRQLPSIHRYKPTEHFKTGTCLCRSPTPVLCSENVDMGQGAQDKGQADCKHVHWQKYLLGQPVQHLLLHKQWLSLLPSYKPWMHLSFLNVGGKIAECV